MRTVKQIVHDIADHLPDQASFDDAMYAPYVRQKLERSPALRRAARASAPFPAPGGMTMHHDIETRPANFVAGGAPRP
ncbi:hypothetical protein [Thiobacillus sp.]|uniref:hypothetical protein n=1 Tax=Thiobacillus sp. TaxID=924 RepID=UPI0025F28010|nr:hypothetical protein [Thiobacillus sp.]